MSSSQKPVPDTLTSYSDEGSGGEGKGNKKNYKKGRRGDPRMHRAVAARLANPKMSLLVALRAGGFVFPESGGSSSYAMEDADKVQLGQRKNQLSRRLRLARQAQEAKKKKNGTKSPSSEKNGEKSSSVAEAAQGEEHEEKHKTDSEQDECEGGDGSLKRKQQSQSCTSVEEDQNKRQKPIEQSSAADAQAPQSQAQAPQAQAPEAQAPPANGPTMPQTPQYQQNMRNMTPLLGNMMQNTLEQHVAISQLQAQLKQLQDFQQSTLAEYQNNVQPQSLLASTLADISRQQQQVFSTPNSNPTPPIKPSPNVDPLLTNASLPTSNSRTAPLLNAPIPQLHTNTITETSATNTAKSANICDASVTSSNSLTSLLRTNNFTDTSSINSLLHCNGMSVPSPSKLTHDDDDSPPDTLNKDEPPEPPVDSLSALTSFAIDKEKMLKALDFYRAESSSLLKRCMLMSGYGPDQTEECDPIYLNFVARAIGDEITRWKRLRATYLQSHAYSLLKSQHEKAFNANDHPTCTSDNDNKQCNHNHNHSNPAPNPPTDHQDTTNHDTDDHKDTASQPSKNDQDSISQFSRDVVSISRDCEDLETISEFSTLEPTEPLFKPCFHGRHIHRLQGKCGHKAVIHQPDGKPAHVDFVIDGKVECYQGLKPIVHRNDSNGALWPSRYKCDQLNCSTLTDDKGHEVKCGETHCDDYCDILVQRPNPKVFNLEDLDLNDDEWNSQLLDLENEGQGDDILLGLIKLGGSN